MNYNDWVAQQLLGGSAPPPPPPMDPGGLSIGASIRGAQAQQAPRQSPQVFIPPESLDPTLAQSAISPERKVIIDREIKKGRPMAQAIALSLQELPLPPGPTREAAELQKLSTMSATLEQNMQQPPTAQLQGDPRMLPGPAASRMPLQPLAPAAPAGPYDPYSVMQNNRLAYQPGPEESVMAPPAPPDMNRIGKNVGTFLLNEGPLAIPRGIENMANPNNTGMEKLGGLNEVLSGAALTAAPVALPAAIRAGVAMPTLARQALMRQAAGSLVGGTAARVGLDAAGVRPEVSEFVSNLVDPAALAVGAKASLGLLAKAGASKGMSLAAITALPKDEVKAVLSKIFPKLDAYTKRSPFVKVARVPEILAAHPDIPDAARAEIVETAQQWAASQAAKNVTKVQPGQVVAELAGEKFDPGRRIRRVPVLAEGEKKIPGAPVGMTTTRQEAAARQRAEALTTEGLAGRDFYNNSGQAIMFHTGDDPQQARNLSAAFSITSPLNAIDANTGMAIKGHNQAIAGYPIDTGRFPGPQSKSIGEVYSGAVTDLGPKREPFLGQIAAGGGYSKPGQSMRQVHDIWQGEVYGYANPDGTPRRGGGFSPLEHRWMDKQDDKVVEALNKKAVGGFTDWDNGNSQAAQWVGARIRSGEIDATDAAKDYSHYFPKAYAQMGRDFLPGAKTGHLVGLADAPMEVRDDFANRVRNFLYDEKKREIAMKGKKMLTGPSFEGPGIWAEGGRVYANPGSQSVAAVGMAKGQAAIDPASLTLIKGNEAEYGLLSGQAAIAGTKLNYNVKAAARDAYDLFPSSGMLKMDDAILKTPEVITHLGDGNIAVIPIKNGTRILNTGMDADAFQTFVKKLNKQVGGAMEGGANVGFFVMNNWDEPAGKIGQEYIKIINDPKAIGAIDRFNKTAPTQAQGWLKVFEAMNKDYGYPLSRVIMDLNEHVAAKGFDGVLDVAKKYGVPLASLVPVMALVVKLQQTPLDRSKN